MNVDWRSTSPYISQEPRRVCAVSVGLSFRAEAVRACMSIIRTLLES